MRAHIFFFGLFLVSVKLIAQSPFKDEAWSYAQLITPDKLKQHVYILASDSMEGRETGQIGQYKAARYLSEQFEKIGLAKINPRKVGSEYFQNLKVQKISWQASFLIHDKDTLTLFKDFYAKGAMLFPEEVSLYPVFAGYGIETANYNSYKNTSVKGKAVIILQGEPMHQKRSLITGTETLSEWHNNWQKKALLAYAKGAACVLIVSPTQQNTFLHNIKRMRETKNGFTLGLEEDLNTEKGFFISEHQLCKVFGIDSVALQRWKQKQSSSPKPLKIANTNIRIKTQASTQLLHTQNVLGVVEGSDLKNEYIFISAHYDHLGKKNDSTIFYGADDDGSGTAALLAMAESFMRAKKEGQGPRRSIVFTAFTGEEMGLLGSGHYTNHPVFPLEQSVADLNIDMIGRIDENHPGDSNYVYLIGSNRLSTELHQLSEETNADYTHLSLDYTYNDPSDPNQLYYRSDHYNFAKKGVPVIFYFTGLHEDYHKITDTPDKLLYIKTSRISQLVFLTAWKLANQDDRIKVDVNR